MNNWQPTSRKSLTNSYPGADFVKFRLVVIISMMDLTASSGDPITACSKTSTLTPPRMSPTANANPPMPPPRIATLKSFEYSGCMSLIPDGWKWGSRPQAASAYGRPGWSCRNNKSPQTTGEKICAYTHKVPTGTFWIIPRRKQGWARRWHEWQAPTTRPQCVHNGLITSWISERRQNQVASQLNPLYADRSKSW